MEGFRSAAVFLAFPLAGQTGWARALDDVLKEKGVITEEDFREVTAARPIEYRIGKGFTFTSPDGRFQLSIGGRGQFQYQYLDKDDANGPVQDTSVFRIRRFKAFMGGHAFTQDLTYRVQVDLAKSGTAQMLEEAWINYRFIEEAQVKAGQYKVPFARQELTSDGALQFVDRSNAVDSFKPSYDIGATVRGSAIGGKLTYDAGIFNGSGQSATRTTNSGAVAARVVFNPFGEMRYSEPDLENSLRPLLSVGANDFANTLKRNGHSTFLDITTATPPYAGAKGWFGKDAANTSDLRQHGTGRRRHVRVRRRIQAARLLRAGGVFRWKGRRKTNGRSAHARGYYAQAGYFLLPKRLEAAARYSCVDPTGTRRGTSRWRSRVRFRTISGGTT